jgi:hypothetical protein
MTATATDPMVQIPASLLQYIDQECIQRSGDRDAARAFNDALDAAFPDGPPGGCGGPIDMDVPYKYDSCQDEHPGQTHEQWGAAYSNDPKYKEGNTMTNVHSIGTTWRDLFPAGRDIYYEGDDPAGFAGQIKTEFGFDPSADPGWGVAIPADEDGDGFTSYRFRCPPEHLDAIYSERFPMGS